MLLGRGLVRLVTRTLSDLYFVVSVEGLALPPEVLLRGALVGVVATLVASLLPAWEATTVSAREALARSVVEERVRALVPRAALVGALLLLAGSGLLLLTERSLGAAFAGLFAVLVGMAALVPATAVLLLGVARPLLGRVGGILGHAGVVVYTEDHDLVEICRGLMHFCAVESCGKCFPCRIGSKRGEELLHKARTEGYKIDRKLFDDLVETLEIGSLCALGGGLPLGVKNALQYFRGELDEYFS